MACRGRLGDGGQGCFLLSLQFVVGGAQSLGEGVVGVAVSGLPQDRGLASGEVGEDALQALAFGVAVRTEDAVGQELGDGVEDGLLAEVDGFGWPA